MVKRVKRVMGRRQQRISDFGYREQKGSTRDTAYVTTAVLDLEMGMRR